MSITLRPADRCRYDIVSLGEVMLRLDPRERRIRTAKSFDVWEGGGEYNVGRGLSRVFGKRAAVITDRDRRVEAAGSDPQVVEVP